MAIKDLQADDRHVWREPVRGSYPDPRVLGWSGLVSLQKSIEFGGPRPPIAHLIGSDLTEAEQDHVTFTMPSSEWFLSSQEYISAGALMMLADAALGCAVAITLPPATLYTTAELSLTFLRPCRAGGVLTAIGRPVDDGRPLSLSQTWITDGDGQRVAHGTSSCFVMPPIEGLEPPDDLEKVTEPIHETPDPFMRDVEGEAIDWDIWRKLSGLEILERQIAGKLPSPPIHYLTGMTLSVVSEGSATFVMPAHEWLTSPLRTIQGGALAMLAHAALVTAVTSTLEPGTAYRPVDVKVNFLRPALADQRELTAHGTVVHRGRRLAIANAEVIGPDGKKIVVATGSTMILPEGRSS